MLHKHHTRRLLQDSAASPPDDGNANLNTFDVNTHFSPSMAIILVVLLSAFFFMGFFSIYIKRCSTRRDDEARMMRAGGVPPRPTDAQTQGVDAAFLEGLPLVTYSSAKKKGTNVDCVVCLTDFNEGEPLCQLPRCKHVFHKECIDMWLYSHTTCPLCRRSVISDGSRSFRWGGSGSLRLSLGQRGSRRESRHGGSTAGPSTPTPNEQQGSLAQADANASTNYDGIHVNAFPRSHSTGHLLLKQAQRSEMAVEMPACSDADDVQPGAGCLPLTPPAVFQRSRSVAAIRGDAPAQMSVSAWMRGAGASLRRAMSLKKVSPSSANYDTGVAAAAAAASGRYTFDRLDPV